MLCETDEYLTVAFPSNFLEPCANGTTLPSPDCPQPGHLAEWMLRFVAIASKGQFCRVRVISSAAWETARTNGSLPDDDSSIIGLVERGVADLSPAVSIRTYARAQRLAYTSTVQASQCLLLYKEHPESPKMLDLHELFAKPSGLWALLGLGTGLLSLLHQCPPAAVLSCRRVLALQRHLGLVFWLMLTLALSLLSNYLCIVFATRVPAKQPITNLRDLHARMADGSFRAYTVSKVFTDLLFSETYFGSEPKLRERILRNNPPIITSNLSDAKLQMMRERPNAKQKIVIFGTMETMKEMQTGLGCPMSVFNAYPAPPLADVSYFRRENPKTAFLRKPIELTSLNIIQHEWKRLQPMQRKNPNAICDSPLPFISRFTLGLERLLGLFYSFACSLAVGIAVAAAEIIRQGRTLKRQRFLRIFIEP